MLSFNNFLDEDDEGPPARERDPESTMEGMEPVRLPPLATARAGLPRRSLLPAPSKSACMHRRQRNRTAVASSA